MAQWSSSPHPISDIRDWKQLNRLELQPDFQRKSVWGEAAKIMLIDSILSDIPMPKIFLSAVLRNQNTHRIIIDGQQRISTILEFLNDKFVLAPPYDGPYVGKVFSELPESTQSKILEYKVDFSEIRYADDSELREIYSRVNKYTVALNKQELRAADYPGDFLKLSRRLSTQHFFDDKRIFTVAHRRRSLDVEYVSELIIAVLSGAADKKNSLDNYYMNLQTWVKSHRNETEELFTKTLGELDIIESDSFSIARTRFKQKSDFYSLFLAVNEFIKVGASFEGLDLSLLHQDFLFLDQHVAPESSITDLKNYAIKCVSAANSSSSRTWRKNFLKTFLNGTLKKYTPKSHELSCLSRMKIELLNQQKLPLKCGACSAELGKNFSTIGVYWPDEEARQFSNMHIICDSCSKNKQVFNVSLDVNMNDNFSDEFYQGTLNFNDD